MTMAWIMAQHNCNRKVEIVLTDYDTDCLAQLDMNVQDATKRLQDKFPSISSSSESCLPSIEVAHLDWNEYDQDQPLLMRTFDEYLDDPEDNTKPIVTFVCGAALVYCEETAACSDQIAKILRQHPQAAVWVVQWPRNGWFQVLQMQLQQKHFLKVEKFLPTDIHPNVHELAQSLMPPQVSLDIKDIKAVRITSPKKMAI
jgi:hypothetical protein